MATGEAGGLVVEGREDIRLLLVQFRLRHKIYSLSSRCATLSRFVQGISRPRRFLDIYVLEVVIVKGSLSNT